jgi:hypothetical protein
MMRNAIAILLVAVVGCKGETVVKPDPKTEEALAQCQRDKAEKDKLVKAVEEENARLMRNQGSGAEIVVSIEGNALTVKPGKPGEVRPIDDKAVAAASKEFLDVVAKSRGAIQKCYEQALKKSAGLATQKVSLTVYATFAPAGNVTTSYSAPQLGEPFDGCFKQVSQKWTVKGSSSEMTYRSVVELTPS